MAKVFLHGWMEEDMWGSMFKIKRKALGSFIGLMEDTIKVSGAKGNNMGKGYIGVQKWIRRKKEYGKMESDKNGAMTKNLELYFSIFK
jgi:hypothetical protein